MRVLVACEACNTCGLFLTVSVGPHKRSDSVQYFLGSDLPTKGGHDRFHTHGRLQEADLSCKCLQVRAMQGCVTAVGTVLSVHSPHCHVDVDVDGGRLPRTRQHAASAVTTCCELLGDHFERQCGFPLDLLPLARIDEVGK